MSKKTAKTIKKAVKGKKFDGNWDELPTRRQLYALTIRSIESGEDFKMPTSKAEAKAMLGYED